jgi:hypothetical protein
MHVGDHRSHVELRDPIGRLSHAPQRTAAAQLASRATTSVVCQTARYRSPFPLSLGDGGVFASAMTVIRYLVSCADDDLRRRSVMAC